MESRVEEVRLFSNVTLDIRDLMEYSGQGKCRRVMCWGDTKNRYREQLRATSRNWEMTHNNHDWKFIIKRM